MSYQAEIRAAVLATAEITELAGDRFFWDIADASAVAPYIVAQTISDNGDTDLGGDRGITFPLIQFSFWAATKETALALYDAFRRNLEGIQLPGETSTALVFAGEHSSYDDVTRLFGHIAEYRAPTNL